MMPAGRTPRPHSASITGLDGRGRRTRPVLPVKRLGPPRNSLPTEQRRAWDQFVKELPWLAESDRAILEVACSLRARFVESEGVLHPSVLNLFKQSTAIVSRSCRSTMMIAPRATVTSHERVPFRRPRSALPRPLARVRIIAIPGGARGKGQPDRLARFRRGAGRCRSLRPQGRTEISSQRFGARRPDGLIQGRQLCSRICWLGLRPKRQSGAAITTSSVSSRRSL